MPEQPGTIVIEYIVLQPQDGGCLLRCPQSLSVPLQSSVQAGLMAASGLSPDQTAELFSRRAVAVFGVTARPGDLLHPGDRIEVLDGLHFDPMESRRRRARHKVEQPKSRRRARD